jgi:predicted ATPase/predicted negative regulator of RcsB-dependent stress response
MTEEQAGNAAIRTPDQRLRVFVSSTLGELAAERVEVSRAISALRLTPVLFELGARPHPPRELYRAYLAQSDIFVGMYWQRYGWVGPGMDISGLEDEFRLSYSIPRLLYVKKPAPDREPGLTAMIDELQTQGTDSYRSFATPRELGRLVRDDLALLLSERFAAANRRGDRSASPALNSDRRGPRSLPVTSTTLIGREQDIVEVSKLLAKPEVRLLTLTGPGGIGKTRLAIAVGEQLEDRYPQEAIFVPLASIAQPELVLPRIATAVGVTIEGGRPPLEVLVEQFAETPTLLVLDNLEQVVGIAPDLDQMLARCPRLKILATSRTVLRLRAEHEYPVGPLTVPVFSARVPIEQIASLPAVQLFVDRAQAVRYDFALTDENALAVADICRALDGLPLAIELAAARARLLEPDALLARLGSRLDALGTGPVDLPARQRTLRATVEWSVGLLDDAEQQMLAALSVFVEGWTVEAAVHVSGLTEDRTLDLLDSLAGHSLVSVDVTGLGPRFRMLGAIRDLAGERLAAGPDLAVVERRHAEYFGAFVENADRPAERQAQWAQRLRTEEGNLGVAIRWFFTHDIAPLPHILLVLCQNIWLFWQMRDRMPEGRAWIQELLLRADALEDRAQAEVLLVSAATAVEVGDDDSARAAVEGIERLKGRIDDPYLDSASQLAVSWILPIGDDFDGALRAASTALDGFREQNEPFMGWAALTVGLLEMTLGQHDAAREHLTEANELGSQFGNKWLESGALIQLASLAVRAGQLEQARAQLVESVDASEDTELSTQTVTFALVVYAQLALAGRDVRRAATALGAADGLRQRAGLRAWPSMRRGEAELATRVAQEIDSDVFKDAFAAGSELNQPEAVALVRGDRMMERSRAR